MKVILLKDVSKVGRKYDIKDISDGYALNLLIPKGLAIAATPSALKQVELQKAKLDGERKISEELLIQNLKGLDGKTISIKGKANDKGHLFAGLHKEQIAAEIQKHTRLQIEPASIQLEHTIKEVGSHDLEVKIGNKGAKFTLVIEAE